LLPCYFRRDGGRISSVCDCGVVAIVEGGEYERLVTAADVIGLPPVQSKRLRLRATWKWAAYQRCDLLAGKHRRRLCGR